MIPKLSAPLVKDIRTGEGILEWVLALADLVAGFTGNMSYAHTALYATILAGIKGTRRLVLKAVAAQGAAGIGAPITPPALETLTKLEPAAVSGVEQVLAEITAAERAATVIQQTPGAAAATITAGLSPELSALTPAAPVAPAPPAAA